MLAQADPNHLQLTAGPQRDRLAVRDRFAAHHRCSQPDQTVRLRSNGDCSASASLRHRQARTDVRLVDEHGLVADGDVGVEVVDPEVGGRRRLLLMSRQGCL